MRERRRRERRLRRPGPGPGGREGSGAEGKKKKKRSAGTRWSSSVVERPVVAGGMLLYPRSRSLALTAFFTAPTVARCASAGSTLQRCPSPPPHHRSLLPPQRRPWPGPHCILGNGSHIIKTGCEGGPLSAAARHRRGAHWQTRNVFVNHYLRRDTHLQREPDGSEIRKNFPLLQSERLRPG